jgi:P4 family phage/plasmid primase-like protien
MSLDEATVLAWVDAGCSVIPIQADGTKRPAGLWKAAMTVRATRDVAREYASKYDGVGVVCGTVSGNLEMLELEGRAIAESYGQRLREAFRDHDAEGLLETLMAGCLTQSPSGGFHIWYRVDGPARGNTKLARRPGKDQPVEVLIETRGEGGFAVVPPSAGRVHPTGKPWTQHIGSPATIPTITAEERDLLHAVAHLLDEMPDDPIPAAPAAVRYDGSAGKRPGDDYNDRATWDEILTPHGWTKARRLGAGYAWRRPGKTDPGISATTGQREDKDRLYVFTTSTEFEAEKPYDKFSAYALLEHGGNFSDASRALRKLGYGDPDKPRDQAADLRGLIADAPAVEGNLAVVRELKRAARKPTTYTDAGNADLMVDEHADHLRYVPSRGAWLTWARTHWAWCEDDGEALQAAIDTIQTIDTSDDDAYKHQIKSLSRRSLEAMIAIARRHNLMRVASDALDADPYALNTPAGVIDLRDGSLRPHSPAEMHTKVTGATYDPDATPIRWLEFLRDTFGGDEEMVTFVQRLAGYSACGIVLHHVLPFLHGAGGNGKSVFLDVIVSVLGDYASTAPSGFLMAGGREDENAVARLAGLRLIVCSEVNQAARFDEAKVKLLTGGDKLTARFLYQRHFTFKPTHKLWLMGNHQPRVDAGGESFWRRLRLLPFTRVVPKEKRIEGLADQLIDAEADAILTWIVQGAQDVLRDGLREPAAVLAATSTYAEEEDALARFMTDRCHIGGGEHVRVDTRDLRAAYEKWCSDEGEKPVTPQVFGRELRTRFGIESGRSHGRRYYIGVTLLSDDNEPADTPWNDR